MLGSETDLDLALIQAAGEVQPRGSHPLVVQVERSLARIARDRRDRDRRYRDARASGGGQPSSRAASGSSTAGHRPLGSAARPSTTVTHGGGAIYDRHGDDLDAPRWYALTSPKAQAYRTQLEAEGRDDDLASLDRRGGLKLRPSAARQLLATGRMAPPKAGALAGSVVARAAQHLAAQSRVAGRA
jgi:hypothetical protein